MASIETISFSPNVVSYTTSSVSKTVVMTTGGSNTVGSFSQYNDSVGKTFTCQGMFGSGLQSATLVSAGQVLNASTFTGNSTLSFGPSASGTVYIGFRAQSGGGGGIGWFSMNLGGTSNDIVVGNKGAQYGNNGESVTVGNSSSPVPELGSAYGVGLLAMGAIGIRRRREAQK